ncbi:hypothetical protein ACGFY9_02170 [Streptomyces sp. NPDC048504]|uniref:hypothetical protein n=1 Tax=Streptomyces sp. NPDC048504 TaxID=3365559 RepID=UPI0037153142
MRKGMRWLLWGLWSICLVIVVWAGWWFVRAMLYAASSDDPPDTVRTVGCAEAMDFSGATLPEDTRDEACTSYTWQGQAYDGTFRMPRAAVRGWLTESFPDGASIPCEADGDLCVRVVHDPRTSGAYDVTVSVRYEGGSAGDTALVTFDANSY